MLVFHRVLLSVSLGFVSQSPCWAIDPSFTDTYSYILGPDLLPDFTFLFPIPPRHLHLGFPQAFQTPPIQAEFITFHSFISTLVNDSTISFETHPCSSLTSSEPPTPAGYTMYTFLTAVPFSPSTSTDSNLNQALRSSLLDNFNSLLKAFHTFVSS